MRFPITILSLAPFVAAACAALSTQVAHAQEVGAYAIVDNQTGYILASDEGDKKRQIASLTKIATAMVVLDWAEVSGSELGRLVPVPPEALAQGPVNPLGLVAGDQLSFRDLLYASLLQSDNVSAYTLAYHTGLALASGGQTQRDLGPTDLFVSQMNALAGQLSMKRTLFLNPHGIDGGDFGKPYSTAMDVARLARYAMSKPAFRFYVSQKERRIAILRAGQELGFLLHNTNELLGSDGIDGVKTGRTTRAGDCVVISSARQPETKQEGETVYITPRRITIVVLGANDRFGAAGNLLRLGWQRYDAWAAAGRTLTPKETL